MTDVKLSWATATVKNGKLKVDLDGEIASDWKQSFESTARLLPGGDWGEIDIKKDTVRVDDVAPGDEERLRHHLESIVEQANADVRAPDTENAHEDGDGDGPDAKMTEAFRAFAVAEGADTEKA